MREKTQMIDARWNAIKPPSWNEKTHQKHRQLLYEILDHDELPECVIAGTFVPDKLQPGDHVIGGIVVATARRLLAVDRGLLGKEKVIEVGYRDIGDITHKSGMMSSSIRISGLTMRTYKIDNIMDKNSVEPFVKYVLDHASGESLNNKLRRIDYEWAELIPKGWGTFGDAHMHSGERKMLYELLDDDEHLEAIIGGRFGPDLRATGGPLNILKEGSLHDGVGVATTSRVIFLDKGIMASEVVELSYRNIESISYSTGVMLGGLKIVGRGGSAVQVEMVRPKESAQTFASIVKNHLDSTRVTAASPQGSTPQSLAPMPVADEIEKLAGLLEKGILTQDEFDTKKKQLLDL